MGNRNSGPEVKEGDALFRRDHQPFREGKLPALEAIESSRLSPVLRGEVRRVIAERHHRLFGH